MSDKQKETSDIFRCSRCGQDHQGLEVHYFKINPIKDEDGTVYDRWLTCPETGDPILMFSLEQSTDGR